MKPFDERKLVYVAGPYSHPDPVENTHKAIAAGELVQANGMTAYIPHISLLWHMVVPHDVDHWYAYDLAVLKRCDALYRMPGKSSGADKEVEYAADHGIPVFVELGELVDWSRG